MPRQKSKIKRSRISKKEKPKKRKSKRKSTFRVNLERQKDRENIRTKIRNLSKKEDLLEQEAYDNETEIKKLEKRLNTQNQPLEKLDPSKLKRMLIRKVATVDQIKNIQLAHQKDKIETYNKLLGEINNKRNRKGKIEEEIFSISEQKEKLQNELDNLLKKEITFEQALHSTQRLEGRPAYKSPSNNPEIIKRVNELNRDQIKLERLAEHTLRLSGEFIFDYDNICNNIGLVRNHLNQIAIYSELEHYVNTGQLDRKEGKSPYGISPYGIFEDSNFIPELELLQPISQRKELNFKYGHNRLTLLIPSDLDNLNDPTDPNRILGQGSFGEIYQGFMNNDRIIIKRLLTSDISSLVTETVIQSHLYCSYNNLISETDDMARIPKIVSVSKYEKDYFIGMERLDNTFTEFIRVAFNTAVKRSKTFSFIRTGIYCIANLLVLLQKTEGFMHRDLHCENIMYKSDSNGFDFYLIDFGYSVLINRNIKTNGNLYSNPQNVLNRSHDMRILLSSLIEAIDQSIWDAFLVYARCLAKRFSYCLLNYYKTPKISEDPISYGFYNEVVNEYDWRFDPNISPDMFDEFNDIEGQTKTPTVNEIQNLPDDIDNHLLVFVKRYYR